ncbi:hypothetical protein N9R78_01595 [Pelagibacteraceae bacterium]|nr:hypothetical protein [Pelagibacteraceae bacterium]|tara:strand:+ start:827 stop:1087 length:261 start_codon:yes stop_codon:yes gene_type:complete
MSKKDDDTVTDKVIDKVVSGEGAATATGAAVGGYFGSSMGIVAFGGGMAATLPLALGGGLVCYLGYKALKYKNRNNELKRKHNEDE